MRAPKETAPLRVLMIGPVPGRYAGVSRVAGLIVSAAPAANIQVTYLSTTAKGKPALHKLALLISALGRAIYLVLFKRPDLIHLHLSKGASLIRKRVFQRMAQMLRVPVVLHLHGFLAAQSENSLPDFYVQAPPWLRPMTLKLLQTADGILALSTLYAESIGNLTKQKQISVLENPVRCADFAGPADRLAAAPKILFMGDFSARKGSRDLLATLPQVRQKFHQVQYIFGGQDQAGQFARLVAEKGLSDFVYLPGFVDGHAKIRLFQQATIFVLPSHQEGVPMALLEAMAAGLPIITTPVGGIPDVIADENGLFVQPGDVAGLANQLIFLLEDSDLQNKMSIKNREKALQKYDLPQYMLKLGAIYQQVLAQ